MSADPVRLFAEALAEHLRKRAASARPGPGDTDTERLVADTRADTLDDVASAILDVLDAHPAPRRRTRSR